MKKSFKPHTKLLRLIRKIEWFTKVKMQVYNRSIAAGNSHA